MSDKPTVVPDWTPTGADVVTPSAGEKSSGFQGSERPPAQHINWFWELITQWIIWVSNGYFTRPSLADDSPVLANTDQDGNERHYLGAEGYWMGPAIQETHRWTGIDTTIKTPADIVSTHRAAFFDPSTASDPSLTIMSGATVPAAFAMGGSVAAIKVLNANVDTWGTIQQDSGTGTAAVPEAPIADLDNTVAVFETVAGVDSTSLSGVKFFLGLHNSAYWSSTLGNAIEDTAVDNIFAMFLASSGSANWAIRVWDNSSAGSATNHNSGVAISATAVHTFRVEVHGVNTPIGVAAASAKARFFIDGALVLETTVDVPSSSYGGALGFLIAGEADATGPTADKTLYCGPVKVAWNNVLDPDVPA